MAKFKYNNSKNASFNYILSKLNCGYYLWKFYKKNVDFYFKFKLVYKLLAKSRKLIIVCQKNFYHTKKIQKQVYNNCIRSKNFLLIIKSG